MGLAARVPSPYVHEGLLLVVAVVLVAACLVAALLLVRPAPAVSIALAGAVVAGTVAFFVSVAHDRHGVPQDVAVWASVGLWVAGSIGLVARRGRRPSRPLRHVAVACLLLTPFAAALLLLAVQQACPLYVTRGAGYCFYDTDVLGACASGVTFLFCVDMLVVALLMFTAGRPAKDKREPSPEEDTVLF